MLSGRIAVKKKQKQQKENDSAIRKAER